MSSSVSNPAVVDARRLTTSRANWMANKAIPDSIMMKDDGLKFFSRHWQ